MTKSRTPEAAKTPLHLTTTREDAAAKIDDRIARGKAILRAPINSEETLDSARREYYTWEEYNRDLLRSIFSSEVIANEYSYSPGFVVASDYSLQREIDNFREDVSDHLRRLDSIKGRLELFPLEPSFAEMVNRNNPVLGDERSVFIVHGHDEALRESVARFLTELDLKPIILREQASRGRTIVEKLEAHSDVGFAVVLLTPDDLGGVNEYSLARRARQNVVLELGYFLAKLGRERVTALYKGEMELPSDLMGVIYVPVDEAGAWKAKLAKEIRATGISIDLNRIL